MSHPSKLDFFDLAKEKGYKTYLYFIYTDSKDLNVARVKLRAKMGLHDVKEAAIRDRYEKSFEVLPQAFEKADEAYIIDNSETPSVVADKQAGKVTSYIEPSKLSPELYNFLEFTFDK